VAFLPRSSDFFDGLPAASRRTNELNNDIT
jgi:hypothetical protein